VIYYAGFVADHHRDYGSLTQEWGNIQQALAAAHRHEDWQRVYDIGRQMTDAWFLRARYSLAREAYQLCYDAARRLGQDAELAQTLFDWGRACIEQGDYAEAQRHLEESLRLYEGTASDPIRAGDVHLALGRVAQELTQFPQAESRLQQALHAFQQAGDQKRIARVNYRYASLAYRRNDFSGARDLGKAAIVHLEGEYLRNALNLLADAHRRLDRLDEAEQYLLRLQAHCEEHQDKAYMAVVNSQFGRLCRARRDFEQAEQYFTRSLEQFRQTGARKDEAYALYDLSLIAEQQADYARGLELADQCLDIFTQFGDTFNLMNTMVHLGDLYRALGEDAQASSFWQRSLTLAELLGNQRYVNGLLQRMHELT
jgi:tetratricopeptide (TPR) repeat protein